MEMTHLTENIIYNELVARGYNVNIGIVELNGKNEAGKSTRRQLEVDFIATLGSRRYYIQSAYSMPDAQKIEQEKRSFKAIGDMFARVIITREAVKAHFDNDGIYILPLKQFLLNAGALEIIA